MLLVSVKPTVSQDYTPKDRSRFEIPKGMQWRFIGPMAGARGSVVLGHPTEPYTFYHGASNGLWRTRDAGMYWEPVGDEYFTSGNIGAMEFSLSNPNVAYVGTGEPQMRNNVSWGDGVYKTTDNGETWTHLGLDETHHISQIRVHPEDPDIVFVGAFGHAFGPNEERGVYRTRDGGKTWEKVLYKGDNAGVIDLVLNPSNPNELFAAIWEFERKAWGPKTGGPNSTLWRSTDGGDTWEDITYKNGLPEGGRGRMGLTMSAADAKKVYALIDSETKPALYVSNDLGENWEFVSDFFQIIGRPFYYSHIYASPHDANELWCANNRTFWSKDGGKNWTVEPGIKDDFHDVWINPQDENKMIITCDGGVMVSLTRGMTWSSQHTQANVQLYRVDVDDDVPYNVYTNGQDVLSYKMPSSSRWGGISRYETKIVGNGETSSVIPKPGDLNTVYNISGGSPMGPGASFTVNKMDTEQNNVRSVVPSPLSGLNAYDLEYRFNWVTPYFVSPHDPNTIYLGGNVVFKTTDEGLNWEVISPDLTNDIKERQKISGTPWLPEYFGQEVYSTIARLDESPLQKGLIWTGSDDGKIYITKDGGENWEDVSIVAEGLPEFSQVYEIEPSPHDAATAYVVFSNFNTYDDYKPYIFKTSDFGKTWENLSAKFPSGEITRTIREDKVRKGLLFAGSETGIFYSLDDGGSWQPLKVNLPAVPVVDIKIKDEDLIIATNGRGVWIMDDITPLREQDASIASKPVHLYSIPDHTRFGYNWWLDYVPGGDPGMKKNYFVQNMRPGLTYYELTWKKVNGERKRKFIDAGDPKPLGPVFYFRLENEPQEIKIEILDASGEVLRTYGEDDMDLAYGGDDFNAGLNKFVWDMRIQMLPTIPTRPPTTIIPIVPPGEYQVRLTVDGNTETQNFRIHMNPKEPFTLEEAESKYAFWMEMYNEARVYTDKVIAALKQRDEVLAKVEKMEKSGLSGSKLRKAQKQVEVIENLANRYEASFVSTGRTLAEIINLPATIFYKMGYVSTMLEHTEGPVSASQIKAYQDALKEAQEVDEAFQQSFSNEVKKLKALVN